jgi:hypothetical protein
MPVTLGNTSISGIGVGGLPSGIVNAATLATNSVTRDKIGYAGAVVQQVYGIKTDTFVSSANSTYVAVTGLSATITPVYSNSKILIICQVHYGCGGTTYGGTIFRNGTAVSRGDASSNRQRVGFGMAFPTDGNQSNTYPYIFLDSPGSTSALTYQLYVLNDNDNNVHINRSSSDTDQSTGKNGTSSITLLEIKQ